MNSLGSTPRIGSLVAFRVLRSDFTYGRPNDFWNVYPGLCIGRLTESRSYQELIFPDNSSVTLEDHYVLDRLLHRTQERVIFAIESTETLKQLLKLDDLRIEEYDADSNSYPWIEYYPIDANNSQRDTPSRETLESTMHKKGFQLIYGVDHQIPILLGQLQK